MTLEGRLSSSCGHRNTIYFDVTLLQINVHACALLCEWVRLLDENQTQTKTNVFTVVAQNFLIIITFPVNNLIYWKNGNAHKWHLDFGVYFPPCVLSTSPVVVKLIILGSPAMHLILTYRGLSFAQRKV